MGMDKARESFFKFKFFTEIQNGQENLSFRNQQIQQSDEQREYESNNHQQHGNGCAYREESALHDRNGLAATETNGHGQHWTDQGHSQNSQQQREEYGK